MASAICFQTTMNPIMRSSKLLVADLSGEDGTPPIPNDGKSDGVKTLTRSGPLCFQSQSNAKQFAVASLIQGDLASRGFIGYHPHLANALGGYKPALMLGHALYWTEHWLATQPHRMGWFWKTAQDWQSVTGLSAYEQSKARATLVQFNVFEERLSGNPAKLHFRVKLAGLSALLNFNENSRGEVNWTQLTPLLGSRVMFFKPLVDVTQSVSGGLVLSHLLSEYRTALKNNQVLASGFFYMKVESERHALGLPIKIHNRARSALKSAGIIQVDYSQEQPPRLLVRVNTDAVLAGISGNGTPLKPKKPPLSVFAEIKQEGTHSSSARQLELLEPSLAQQHDEIMGLISGQKSVASTKTTPQLFPFYETGSSLSAKLDMPKVENWIFPFCETGSSLSPKLSIQIEITNPTTTTREVEVAASQPGDGRSRNVENNGTANSIATALVLPATLDKRHHENALKLVSRAPQPLQQGILDELEGALQSGKSIRNILGWLNSIVDKANNGTLILGMADHIADIRKGRELQAERERTMVTTTGHSKDSSASIAVDTRPANPEVVQAGRNRLKTLQIEMKNKQLGVSK